MKELIMEEMLEVNGGKNIMNYGGGFGGSMGGFGGSVGEEIIGGNMPNSQESTTHHMHETFTKAVNDIIHKIAEKQSHKTSSQVDKDIYHGN